MGIEWSVNNERLLEKARDANVEIRSYADWKQLGKFVRKGEKQRAFRVQDGWRGVYNPVSGETDSEPKYATCYGFLASQVR